MGEGQDAELINTRLTEATFLKIDLRGKTAGAFFTRPVPPGTSYSHKLGSPQQYLGPCRKTLASSSDKAEESSKEFESISISIHLSLLSDSTERKWKIENAINISTSEPSAKSFPRHTPTCSIFKQSYHKFMSSTGPNFVGVISTAKLTEPLF
jgi:hypothetical protein